MNISNYVTCGWRAYGLRTIDVSVFLFDLEYSKMTGTLEIEFQLFGYGFWLLVAVREPSKEFVDAMKKVMDAVGERAGGTK